MIDISKRIKIAKTHKFNVTEANFEKYRRVQSRVLITPRSSNYNVGERIIIKAHNGKQYTGDEILGEIKSIEETGDMISIKFRLFCVTKRI